MKLYTRTGDRGKTSLFSGERVFKNHPRIEAYGAVDELNSILGVLAAGLPEEAEGIGEEVRRIQGDLLHMGAWLSTTAAAPAAGLLTAFSMERSHYLESAIDRMEAKLAKLTGFILPGGEMSASLAHMARAICRRAERRLVALTLSGEDSLAEEISKPLIFLNRLSDYLFALARYCNHVRKTPDVRW